MKARLWLAALFLLPTLAQARNVQIRWTPSPDPVVRYLPYSCSGAGCTGFASMNQPFPAPCGNPCVGTFTVPDPLTNIVMCFTMEAENSTGQRSDKSNTVCQTIPTVTTTTTSSTSSSSTSSTSTSSTSSTSTSSSSTVTSTSSTTSTTRPRPPVLLDATIASNGRLKGVFLARDDRDIPDGTELKLLFSRANGTITTYGGYQSGMPGPLGFEVGPAGRIRQLFLPLGNDDLDDTQMTVQYREPGAAQWTVVDRTWKIKDKRS